MYNRLGLAVYLSRFEDQKPMLEKMAGSGYIVFTSFHIQEEFDAIAHYRDEALEMIKWLKDHAFQILADVSPRTITFFEEKNLNSLLETLNVPMLRPDYGFEFEDLLKMDAQSDIVVNASTLTKDFIETLQKENMEVYAMHNFYPREETGLDEALYETMNRAMKDAVKGIISFIPGDTALRGPIFKGLPTLESHRHQPPYVGYLDLIINHENAYVFIGDSGISDQQFEWIDAFNKDDIITLPVMFESKYAYLYDQVFTIRPDSPTSLKRLQESREYATQGDKTAPGTIEARPKGTITMDNDRYKRYSGEIQITAKDYPLDSRVNVIGHIPDEYLGILRTIKNHQKIRFIKI